MFSIDPVSADRYNRLNTREKEKTMEKMIDENGNEWMVGYGDEADYIPGYDDGEWDPVMGDVDDYPETDDEWLDDFQGEEDFA
jgi:hypothetical protein